jgi:hypothetical protein
VDRSHTLGNAFLKIGIENQLAPNFFPLSCFLIPPPRHSPKPAPLSPFLLHHRRPSIIFFALSFPLSLSQTRLRWGLSCSENDGDFTQAPALLTDLAVGLRHRQLGSDIRRLGSLNRVGVLCSLSIWCSCRFSCVYVNLVYIAFGNALTEWVWDEF